MLDLMLLFLVGGLIVTFVLNVAIRIKESRAPRPVEPGPLMFGQTVRSGGGADFLAAGLVAMCSFFVPLIIWMASSPATVRYGNTVARINEGHSGVRWDVAVPLLVIAFLVNTSIIRSRHKGLLDWSWSAATAAAVLCGSSTAWYWIVG